MSSEQVLPGPGHDAPGADRPDDDAWLAAIAGEEPPTRRWIPGPGRIPRRLTRSSGQIRLKQDPRWKAEQLTPALIRWTTPTGRQHTTEPTRHPI
jgi:hypothetical protein